jgi:hypothetical protein
MSERYAIQQAARVLSQEPRRIANAKSDKPLLCSG